MKKVFLVAAVTVAVCMGSVAQAALHFSKADLLSMTQYAPLTFGFTTNIGSSVGTSMTDDSNYEYFGTSPHPMSGLAGTTGNLANNGTMPANPDNWQAMAAYSLPASGLLALQNAIIGGETTLSSVVFNDNDDFWTVGIWVLTQDPDLQGPGNPFGIGGTNSSLLLASLPGTNSGAVSIDLTTLNVPPASIIGAGVFVALPAIADQDPERPQGSADAFHASWGVPEPTSILVWGALGIVSLAAGRRNRG